MSSSPESIAAGSVLQHYRLVERLGGAPQTWLAEDSRNGRKVAVKILSRLLPKDKGTRDSMLKQLRLKAAVSHPGIANVIHVDIDLDALWMASELVEGETLTSRALREKVSRQDFLRFAWQMADTLAAVHASGIVLGQLTGGSWIITPENDVKLVGFRFSSFMGKHETGQTLLSAIKPSNLREAGYLSPEQVTGKMVTSKTDIFALGVCLYELIAGALPFQGATVADVAQAIATTSPAAPQNPAIERPLLGPIGKCIHKNPDSRYEKVAFLKDDLAKLAPDVETIARRRGVSSPGSITMTRKPAAIAADTFIVVGELPYHELLRKKDPGRAGRLENTMQQYLGEAVYLFDGKVLDSFGPVMVASLPDGETAVKAARKGLADLVEHNMTHGEEPVEPRMLVHFGELVPTAGKPEGSGLTTAMGVLEAMEPMQLLVSKPVVDKLDVQGQPVHVGRLADIDFYQAPDIREPQPEAPPLPPSSATPAPAPNAPVASAVAASDDIHAPATATSDDESPAPTKPPRKTKATTERKKGLSLALIGVAAILVILVGAAAAVYTLVFGRKSSPVPVVQAPAEPAVSAVRVDPNKLHFGGFSVELPSVPAVIPGEDASEQPSEPTPAVPELEAPPTDVELETTASEIRAGVEVLLGLDRSLTLVPSAVEDARTIRGRLTRTAAGIVLTPGITDGTTSSESEPIAVTGASGAALSYVRQVCAMLGRDLSFLPGDDPTITSYLDARALERRGDLTGALTAINRVTAVQSDFVPGLRLQMRVLLALDQDDQAAETARRVAILDPRDAEIRKRLAEWEFERGNPGRGLVWLGALIEIEPNNIDALTRLGQYAAAVGDEERFNAAFARLKPLPNEHPRLSAGDIILARGRLDAAAKKYYEDLDTQPDNSMLSLKIGRVAVLRRSDTIIQSEIERLERLQAPFELAMMQAYVAANRGNVESAGLALRRAEETASPLDSVHTASAEVYLLLNRQQQVLESLEKAVARSEPTHDYILSNPIFGYLGEDPKFKRVLQKIGEQKESITAALGNINL
jgi:tetratricopeptide (TPR) repeat protein